MIIYDIKNFLSESVDWWECFGNFGDWFWWIFGTVISGITLYFVYQTYTQQKQEIERLKQESKEQWFQSFFSWVFVPKIEWLLNSIDSTTGVYNPHNELTNLTKIIHTNTTYMYWVWWPEHREVPPNAEKYIELWQSIIDLHNFILDEINDKIQINHQSWYKIILNQIISEKEIIWFQKYIITASEWKRWTDLIWV